MRNKKSAEWEQKELLLFERVRNDKDDIDAKTKILKIYTPYIQSLSSRLIPRCDSRHQDLVQLASIKALRAMEKFDLSRGLKFSNYLFYWIKSANSEIQRKTMLKFSCKQIEGFFSIGKEVSGGLLNTDEEIDRKFGQSLRKAYRARVIVGAEKQSRFERSETVWDRGSRDSSEEEGTEQEKSCKAKEIREKFLEVEQNLENKRKRKGAIVFRMKNGMNENYLTVRKRMTYGEISKTFGVSGTSARDWEKAFFEEVRKNCNLADYV